MMRNKLCSLAVIVILSACKDDVKDYCAFPEATVFSFLDNRVSIEVPSELLNHIDTSNHDFEVNPRLIYTSVLTSKDSTNSLFIIAEDFGDSDIKTKYVERNLQRLRSVQMTIVKYSNGYLFENYDTLNGKMSGEFIFEGKQEKADVVTGGITFYINRIRIEMVVILSNNDYTATKERVRCILNSVKLPPKK